MTNQQILRQMEEKLLNCYGDIMSPEYCSVLTEELAPLITENTKYRSPLVSWCLGQNIQKDIIISINDGMEWSLKELAETLDNNIFDIPAAVLLFSLAEQAPLTFEHIFSVAEKLCFADKRLFNDDSPECTLAVFDDSVWFFFIEENNDDSLMKKYQLWQVLLQCPELAEIVNDDTNENGVFAELINGRYEVFYDGRFSDETL